MTPFLLLLAVVATTGANLLFGDDPKAPPYVESLKEIDKAKAILKEQILSMSPNIPLLNDSRRHYAEITHVIYSMAQVIANSCFLPDYDKEYPLVVNGSDPEAIQNPEKVIETTKILLKQFDDRTKALTELIVYICPKDIEAQKCDVIIEHIIKKNPRLYVREDELLLAGGKAAEEFNNKAKKFDEVSKDLDAHRYVIEGSKELKEVIYAFADVLRILRVTRC